MFAFAVILCYAPSMGETAAFVAADPTTRQVTDPATIPLLRRVVESLAVMRPGRYSLYLGRPDPTEVRADWDQEARLMQSARRTVVTTPETTPLPAAVERRNPGLGWLTRVWFSAVLGEQTAMALICEPTLRDAERAWLLTEPQTVRRFVGAVKAELARPDPELLAV